MRISARNKQINKTKTQQEKVRKTPIGDAELIAGAWIYARLVACTPGMYSASINFCSEQCEALLCLFGVKAGTTEKRHVKKICHTKFPSYLVNYQM